jgi:hypothetical protein
VEERKRINTGCTGYLEQGRAYPAGTGERGTVRDFPERRSAPRPNTAFRLPPAVSGVDAARWANANDIHTVRGRRL